MTEIENLRIDCAIAGKLWSRTFSGLLMATLRSYGSDVLDCLWAALLRSHRHPRPVGQPSHPRATPRLVLSEELVRRPVTARTIGMARPNARCCA